MDMNIALIAGHLAFGLIAFSFVVKDILWLRIVSIIASLFSVFYNWVIPIEPMWIPIGWNFVFVALNLYHIAVIVYEKRPVHMSPKHKELYDTMFKNLTPVEFLKITKLADWEHYRAGDVITQEGHKVPDLNLIYNGTVEVRVNKEIVAQLRDGQFVGEMSFLTGKPATATCIVKHDAVILVWKQDEFRELLKRNPSLYFTIQSLLSTQLSSSLVAQSKSL
tara:strand:+ start:613 stop:1275 length:663 start_codon:yes stop_codon:yes gene_type:complete